MYQLETDERTHFREMLFYILHHRQVRTVFQPIVSLRDGSVFGYEALSRGPEGTDLESPSVLFEYAQRYGKLWELELLCRTKAIEAASCLVPPIRLFLNVTPNIMHDIKFRQGFTKEYLHQYGINPENVIFEITEKEAVDNISDFIKTIDNYKNQNYKIAIDDTGAGYSGLNMISDIHPHFIKIDMNLIRDIDKDGTKQSLVKSMSQFASLSNTYLIAEGIETEGELQKLMDIGIDFGQGFFIKKPSATIDPIESDALQLIQAASQKRDHVMCNRLSNINIGSISRPLKPIAPNTLVDSVLEMMKKDGALQGFCITSEDSVLGVITRNDLFRSISDKYGYNLYANKPIQVIMSREFLCVDHTSSVDAVAKKAMHRHYDKIYDFITVTREDKYCGIVTVKDLLEKSIEIEVINAKHLNPLSELPGNMLIEKELETAVAAAEDTVVLYFDIDNFKSYNDVYGFENGDRFIKCLASILKKNVPVENFIGHIGGDDFMAILPEGQAEAACQNIIAEFDRSVLLYYNQNDLDQGYIVTKNRCGVEEKFPLLTLSIAGMFSRQYVTIFELSESLARLKKQCKQKQGSNYMIS